MGNPPHRSRVGMVLRSGRFIQSVEFSGLERGRESVIAKFRLLERIAVELSNRERSTRLTSEGPRLYCVERSPMEVSSIGCRPNRRLASGKTASCKNQKRLAGDAPRPAKPIALVPP